MRRRRSKRKLRLAELSVRPKLLVGRLATCGLLLAVGCTGSDSGASADGAAGDLRIAPVQGVCPKGSPPPPTYPSGCPPTFPEAGSCCAVPGAACLYPAGDDTIRDLALCIDDSDHAPFWQQTFVLDRETCRSSTDTIVLGGAAAPACAERETTPCHACNCPPSDALCASRCGTPSGLLTPQEELTSDFANLVQGCGNPPNECFLQVNFAAGCATSLIAAMPGPPGAFDTLLECIERALDSVHFECADSIECAIISYSTLP